MFQSVGLGIAASIGIAGAAIRTAVEDSPRVAENLDIVGREGRKAMSNLGR